MLADNIRQDLNTALKSGESLKVLVLRMLLSEMNYKKIDLQRELTDEDVLSVVGKEVKKRREAIESFSAAGRTEQTETEKQELGILLRYLPLQMDETEIESEIRQALKSIPNREFGQVMKVVAPQFKGRAEGAVVAGIVKTLLSN